MSIEILMSHPKYDQVKLWVEKQREHGIGWDDLLYARKGSEEGLCQFLETKRIEDFWPEMDTELWTEYISLKKKNDEESGTIFILSDGERNNCTKPIWKDSTWCRYVCRLQEKGFSEKSIHEIERANEAILHQLNDGNEEKDPSMGLVIGNVQSGKTANMTGLMAMAGDNGLNLFIILTGVIESLREQTRDRLEADLNLQGNLVWDVIDDLKIGSRGTGKKADQLRWINSEKRYFITCLKNSKRLKQLHQWMTKSPNVMKNMKVVVIDDEADQASINTKDVSKEERTACNRWITNIVHSLDSKGRPLETKFKAMNYIGFTATPYGNILNENGGKSLYPRTFIEYLKPSEDYFGPAQIFGVEGEDADSPSKDGLDIIRLVEQEDVDGIKRIHAGRGQDLPDSLKRAVLWFLCCVAAQRLNPGYIAPVSMLIHTSINMHHHSNVEEILSGWLTKMCSSEHRNDLMGMCKSVWDYETSRFSLDTFKGQFPTYGSLEKVKEQPRYEEILPELEKLVSEEVTYIKMDDDKEPYYTNGIHICIDNSGNNKIGSDGSNLRLIYPNEYNRPEKAPAFIIIGGATLSRGLTLEGLVSTYFLRSAGQADSLMQMGRWFGYRRGYELLPRIWMTERTFAQFKFLSNLDSELGMEIETMHAQHASPIHYGPKVLNTPKVSFIRITAKNKMQSSKKSRYSFTGCNHQTYLFEKNPEVLRQNLQVTKDFIESLGNPYSFPENTVRRTQGSVVWYGVPTEKIAEFLLGYSFQKNQSSFVDMDSMVKWLKDTKVRSLFPKWNVILAGNHRVRDRKWRTVNAEVEMVIRSRKEGKSDDVVNIGAVLSYIDLLADVAAEKGSDLEQALEKTKQRVSRADIAKIREEAGFGSTPQLLLYIIDKESIPSRSKSDSSRERLPLGTEEHVAAVAIQIPGQEAGNGEASYISIPPLEVVEEADINDKDIEGE